MRDLSEAASLYGTLSKVIDYDVKSDTVQSAESLTRKLRRVRQGLDLIRELFQNFLSTEYVSFLIYINYKNFNLSSYTSIDKSCLFSYTIQKLQSFVITYRNNIMSCDVTKTTVLCHVF